jgi:hypothetical protein
MKSRHEDAPVHRGTWLASCRVGPSILLDPFNLSNVLEALASTGSTLSDSLLHMSNWKVRPLAMRHRVVNRTSRTIQAHWDGTCVRQLQVVDASRGWKGADLEPSLTR